MKPSADWLIKLLDAVVAAIICTHCMILSIDGTIYSENLFCQNFLKFRKIANECHCPPSGTQVNNDKTVAEAKSSSKL